MTASAVPAGGDGADVTRSAPSPAPAVAWADRVFVIPAYCIRARGAACDRCVAACPAGAVSFAGEASPDGTGGSTDPMSASREGNLCAGGAAPAKSASAPTIDHEACTRCGICLGVCDAFSSPQVTLEDLLGRVRRIAEAGGHAVFCCEECAGGRDELAARAVVLPCLAAAPAELWCAALAVDAGASIALDFARCEECPRAGTVGANRLAQAVEQAEAWSGRAVGFAEAVPLRDNLLRDLLQPGDDEQARRSVLAGLVNEAGDIASGRRRERNSPVLQQFYERRERMRAQTRRMQAEGLRPEGFGGEPGRARKTVWPTRALLLAAIERDPAIAARVPVRLAQIDDAACTDAGACVAACPTGAIEPREIESAMRVDARCCIGCGLCVSACESGAIALVEATGEALLA